jgi:hypothetical protein
MLTFPLASGCGGTTYEKKKRKKKEIVKTLLMLHCVGTLTQ